MLWVLLGQILYVTFALICLCPDQVCERFYHKVEMNFYMLRISCRLLGRFYYYLRFRKSK
jgi:hypothetical protein